MKKIGRGCTSNKDFKLYNCKAIHNFALMSTVYNLPRFIFNVDSLIPVLIELPYCIDLTLKHKDLMES